MEEWRDIKDYEGIYQVSNLGRVKSLVGSYGRIRTKILDQKPDAHGYKRVALYKNGNREEFKVHRLVAEAFIPNPNNLPCVNHKIDDFEHRSDNRVENLEWCTYEYNNNYGSRNEKLSRAMKGRPFTEEHKNNLKGRRDSITLSKNPRARRVRCITTGKEFDCIKEAAEFYGIERRSISSCCRGKIKSCGKLKDGTKLVWEYLN